MTPKEKAEDLIDKMWINGVDEYESLECALIAVNEILNIENIKPYILHKEIIEFYEEVKQEIQKL
jgi:hypothetical protein